MSKKGDNEPKKGTSGSDLEKSPPKNVEPMEDVESSKPEEPKSEPPTTEDEAQPASEPPVTDQHNVNADGKAPSEMDIEPAAPASYKMDVDDPAEGFVIVDEGGVEDQLAQEKATEGKGVNIASEKEDVGAGAQPPDNVDSTAAPKLDTEMKGTFPPFCK